MEVTVAMQRSLSRGDHKRVEFQIEELHNQPIALVVNPHCASESCDDLQKYECSGPTHETLA